MFKSTFEINEKSEILGIVEQLSEKLTHQGVDQLVSQEALEHFRMKIEPVLDRGKNISTMGSQMRVDSVVKGDGYEISVKARFGIKDSFWKRLFKGS